MNQGLSASRPLWRLVLVTARPRQWTKNLLLLAAPAAAGVLTEWDRVVPVLIAAVIFTLASAGVYFLNDVADRHADSGHDVKKARPVASGELGTGLASSIGAGLLVLSLAASALFEPRGFSIALVLYLAISLSYTAVLKNHAILDVTAVASGFIIRAVAGGLAAGVPISQWFLIVVSFGSLFVVAGKRFAERSSESSGGSGGRLTLNEYSPEFLNFVRSMSAAGAVLGYCLWAFERAEGNPAGVLVELSIAPFVVAILRYALLLERGLGEFPEELFIKDRFLQATGVVWVAVLGFGLYGF